MNVKHSILRSILCGFMISLSAPLFCMEAGTSEIPKAQGEQQVSRARQEAASAEHSPEASLLVVLALEAFRAQSKNADNKSTVEDKAEGQVKNFEHWWTQSSDISKAMAVGLFAITSYFILNAICKPKNAQGNSSSLLSMLFGGLGLLGLKNPIAARMEKDQSVVKDFINKDQGIDLEAGKDYADNVKKWWNLYQDGNSLIQRVQKGISNVTGSIFARPTKSKTTSVQSNNLAQANATNQSSWQPEATPVSTQSRPSVAIDLSKVKKEKIMGQNKEVDVTDLSTPPASPQRPSNGKEEVEVSPAVVKAVAQRSTLEVPAAAAAVQEPSRTMGWVNWFLGTVDDTLSSTNEVQSK